MRDMKIDDFIEDLASKSPAPGGGGASALSGALGVALTSMVYNLTIGKKSYEQLDDKLKNKLNFNLERCKELKDDMLIFMNKDKEAFLALMDSYKLPKETDEEKNIRKATIEMCTMKAMDVPFQLAKITIEFYENIKFAAKYGNKNLISDAAVSAIMISACIESSIVNTEVNLSFIEDNILKDKVKKELYQLKVMNNKLKSDLLSYTDSIINKE